MKPLLPMLATAAAPFDDPDYLFEVKWDGVRALAASEAGRCRLWGHTGADYTARYAELAVLGRSGRGNSATWGSCDTGGAPRQALPWRSAWPRGGGCSRWLAVR